MLGMGHHGYYVAASFALVFFSLGIVAWLSMSSSRSILKKVKKNYWSN